MDKYPNLPKSGFKAMLNDEIAEIVPQCYLNIFEVICIEEPIIDNEKVMPFTKGNTYLVEKAGGGDDDVVFYIEDDNGKEQRFFNWQIIFALPKTSDTQRLG